MDKEKIEMTSVVKCPMCTTAHLPLKGNLKPGDYACTCENCGHFFKFRSIGDFKDTISITINGTSYEVGNEFHQATSLVEFMRRVGISRGTKGCCFEGGCGVCLVVAKLLDPLTGKQRSYTINSCLIQLYTCDGLDITTIEGLGNTSVGLHPIQERLAKFDGAQCGFCSPGQVMNMYGLLQNNPQPTMKEVEDTFDATLCRCTGYRSILDSMKSFAKDAPTSLRKYGGVIDIEELDGKLCKKTGKACIGHCKIKGDNSDTCSNSVARPLRIVNNLGQWFKPLTLAELYPILKQYANESYRLVFGNTGFGVYGEVGPWNYSVLIDIRGVQDLYTVDLSPSDHIIFGANVSLTAVKEALETTTDTGLPYAKSFVDHLGLVASTSVRNMSTWAGNLALKNLHHDFASDVFTMLETVGTKVTVGDSEGVLTEYSLPDFLNVDLKGKVIVSMRLPKYSTSDFVIRTVRTSKRLQLCDADVISGFNFQVDANNDCLVKSKPSIIIQGISGTLIHAVQTESFLINKKLGDTTVLSVALITLAGEVIPNTGPLSPSPTYLKSLAIGQFYKFVLGLCQNKCSGRYMSGGTDLVRPVMTGSQDYGTPDPTMFPVSKPMMKTVAYNLTTGEIRYTADTPPVEKLLYAAPVLTTLGNAKIDKIDPTAALQIPSVVKFVSYKDIPGQNNWRTDTDIQELMVSSDVFFAGAVVGVLLAEDEVTAQSSRWGVQVTYKDIQPCITSLEDAIQQKSFFPKSGTWTKGNAAAAMAAAPHRITGRCNSPEQYNFHLENQTALCTPTDTGGMDIKVTAQRAMAAQQTVSTVLGIKESRITVEVPRMGGAFGGKIRYPPLVAGLCAVSAHAVKGPVLLHMDLHTNMQFQGRRTYFITDYEIGFDDSGKILAIVATTYSDVGAKETPGYYSDHTQAVFDNTYYIPNWDYTVQPCKTHKLPASAVRAPATAPAVFMMECLIDHVATYLKKDHLEVRKINLFQDGQTTLTGKVLEHCLIRDVVGQLETDIKYADRLQAVNDFNKNNRWKKRGIQVMPSRYPMSWNKFFHTVSVNINTGDGSVFICHGGIDMGQGINTKILQCCAYKLGVPIENIEIKTSSTTTSPNSLTTGGSTATELICLSVLRCCDDLLAKMAPSKAKLVNPTWVQIVKQCYSDVVDLRAYSMPRIIETGEHYNTWGACCVEVELDVLTGQYQIRQVDYLFDCGTSLNPELDLGQLEGGFMMGCGLFLLEDMKYEANTGRILNDGTWEYKIPLTKDLPFVFNVKFARNVPNPIGVLGSKVCGESPVASGGCVVLALKRAVEAAQAEVGQEGWFQLICPATVDVIQTACLNDLSQYTFGN